MKQEAIYGTREKNSNARRGLMRTLALGSAPREYVIGSERRT